MAFFDESLVATYVQERIQQTVPSLSRHGNRWTFRCPICGDSKRSTRKRRGNYYPKNNSFYCFNEGCSCSGLWIVAKFEGIDISEVKRNFIEWSRLMSPDAPAGRTASRDGGDARDVAEAAEPVPGEFSIPDTWTEIPPAVDRILVERRIHEAPFRPRKWKLYFDVKSKRIVIPWTKDNRIVYYQTRAITGKQIPKYLFPPDVQKPIFGMDSIDHSFPYVFLLEGVFDAIFIKNGLAIGGKTMTPHQKDIADGLLQRKVMLFDNQWTDRSGMTETMKIATSDRKQLLFIWPKEVREKDLNECAMSNPGFIERLKDLGFVESRIFSGARAIMELRLDK